MNSLCYIVLCFPALYPKCLTRNRLLLPVGQHGVFLINTFISYECKGNALKIPLKDTTVSVSHPTHTQYFLTLPCLVIQKLGKTSTWDIIRSFLPTWISWHQITRKVSSGVISMKRGMLIGPPLCVMIHSLVCVKNEIGLICGGILGDDEFG